MITRILLAVDDSEGALAAARVAIDLAARLGARLRVVNVVQDGRFGQTLEAASGHPGLGARRGHAAAAVLGHVAELARRCGVKAETSQLQGYPARRILDRNHQELAPRNACKVFRHEGRDRDVLRLRRECAARNHQRNNQSCDRLHPRPSHTPAMTGRGVDL